VRPDGSAVTTLAVHGWDVLWSPGAGRIAYFRDPPRPSGEGWQLQVWTALPDGSDARLLITQRKECCFNIAPSLTWSPNGTTLVASRAKGQIIDAATGAARPPAWWGPGWPSPIGTSWMPSWRP
jgi:Tol biopolymer transport system component